MDVVGSIFRYIVDYGTNTMLFGRLSFSIWTTLFPVQHKSRIKSAFLIPNQVINQCNA